MSKRIAVVADDPERLTHLRALLAAEDYDVYSQILGRYTPNFLKEHRPAAIVFDSRGPWPEILSFLSRLKADLELWKTPVVLSVDAREVFDKTAKLAAQGCLVAGRHTPPTHLLAALDRVLGRATQRSRQTSRQ